MSPIFGLAISLLLSQSFCLNPIFQPRKSNLVADYLNKTLDSILANISDINTIPEISLGEGVGSLSNVVQNITKDLTKKIDGYRSFGFTLDMEFNKIAIWGDYDFVYLDLPGLIPLFGKGPFFIRMDAINLNAVINPVFNSLDNKFDINILKFDIIVKNSTVKFDNLMNDPYVADFLNELLSNLAPDLITLLIQRLLEIAKPIIDFYGNGIVTCIKTEFLTGKIDKCIQDLFRSKYEASFLSEITNKLRRELNGAGNV